MALISFPLSFLNGNPLSPFPKQKKTLRRAPPVACRWSVDEGSSSEAKLAKLAMVTLAAGMLAFGSVDRAAAAKSGERVGGQDFRSEAPKINNSRTNFNVNPPIFTPGPGPGPGPMPGPGNGVSVGRGYDVFVAFLVLGAIAAAIPRVVGSKDYEDDAY